MGENDILFSFTHRDVFRSVSCHDHQTKTFGCLARSVPHSRPLRRATTNTAEATGRSLGSFGRWQWIVEELSHRSSPRAKAGPRLRRNRTARPRNAAVTAKPIQSPSVLRNLPGVRCVAGSIGKVPGA